MKRHHTISMYRRLATVIMLGGMAWLAGCASVPEPLRAGPEQSPDAAAVRLAPEQYRGSAVRWGGVIVAVENGPTQSEVEVVSRPLGSNTRPLETDQTAGRFIARIGGFIDPVNFSAGREISVVGVVEGVEQRKIGSYPYSYPVVNASGYYLWPERPPPAPYPYYYYSPFYDPWYPYGPYPYHYPYP